MRIRRTITAVMLSLVGALCAASCVQSPETASGMDGAVGAGTTEVTDPPDGYRRGDTSEAITIFNRVRCPESDNGAECMERCAEAGISCPAGLRHPYRNDGGMGELFECRGIVVARTCWYFYDAISEICVLGNRGVLYCRYQGGRP